MSPKIPKDLLNQARNFALKAYGGDLLAGPGESLYGHSLATGIIALSIIPESYVTKLAELSSTSPDAVKAAIMLAGLMHDWGKALAPYQEYLRGMHSHAPIRHEISSFIALTTLMKPKKGAELCYLAMAGAVLYHHHGLYDFTEKIIKYLRGGVRAWPNLRDKERGEEYKADVYRKLTRLRIALNDYLTNTEASSILSTIENSEHVIGGLAEVNALTKVVGKAVIEVEEAVNRLRHAVTPVLAALMMGDNISACIARKRDNERKRILLIVKASIPVALLNSNSIAEGLNAADLSSYAEYLPRNLLGLLTARGDRDEYE